MLSFHSGVNRSPLVSVSDRLKGLLPSGLEVKMPDELVEALYRLLDLVSVYLCLSASTAVNAFTHTHTHKVLFPHQWLTQHMKE